MNIINTVLSDGSIARACQYIFLFGVLPSVVGSLISMVFMKG